ncbi:hypothetical protein DCC79_06320 [bacterium]|nr:MAG: hypothetical protein DCC79_06320 [bacterium]
MTPPVEERLPTADARPVPTALVGRQTVLRPYTAGFTEAELERLYRWACDADLVQLTSGMPLDVSFEAFKAMFEASAARHSASRDALFAILRADGGLIGRAGLFGVDRQDGSAELGVVIGDRRAWNRGLGREVAALLVRHAFDTLGRDTVTLRTYPDNVRARRAFAAAGFRVVGERRRFTLDRGLHTEVEMRVRRGDVPPSASTAGDPRRFPPA